MQGVDRLRRYLESRGLSGRFPDALTLTREPYYLDGKDAGDFDVMSADVTSPDGIVVSRHRTYLCPKGDGKLTEIDGAPVTARKLTKGQIPKGSAIRLCNEKDVLAVAEGVETALAVREGSGVACWSCVSATGLALFEPPPWAYLIEIWGDTDESQAGQRAAARLSDRLRGKGVDVRVMLPTVVGRDWLDVLVEEGEDALLAARETAARLWRASRAGREALEDAALLRKAIR